MNRHAEAATTLAFVDKLLEEVPFAIQRLQTDRGTEFFAGVVPRRLSVEAIRFRPIRPRSPHLNDNVERARKSSGRPPRRMDRACWRER
jgi:hypothetical protein